MTEADRGTHPQDQPGQSVEERARQLYAVILRCEDNEPGHEILRGCNPQSHIAEALTACAAEARKEEAAKHKPLGDKDSCYCGCRAHEEKALREAAERQLAEAKRGIEDLTAKVVAARSERDDARDSLSAAKAEG